MEEELIQSKFNLDPKTKSYIETNSLMHVN